MPSRQLLPLAVLILLTASCGDGPAKDQAPSLVIGQGDEASQAIIHQMPTPNELFVLVRQIDGRGDASLLNPADRADRYATLRGRAVNFGVYSTALVYASTFKLNVEVARYYLATKKLAGALGLSAVFTDAEFVRLESNLTRGDSLEIISNDVYLRAYERLQEADMGTVLSMVLVGGWTESMYLMMRHGGPDGQQDERLLRRVAEQKPTLEHLIALIEVQAADADVAELRDRLQGILDIYDQVNVQRKPHGGKSPSGRMVLGDDVRLDISEDKFQALREAIDRLRNDLVLPEDRPNV